MSVYVDDDREMPRFRVNRQVMVDSAVFALERERIFDKCWLYVGHESELAKPNDFLTRTLGGRPVVFARDAKGQVRVWLNSCPHRGAMLCREGGGNARFLTCFYHGWSFSSAGQMVSMPGDEAYGETSSGRVWRRLRRWIPIAGSCSRRSIRMRWICGRIWPVRRSTWI